MPKQSTRRRLLLSSAILIVSAAAALTLALLDQSRVAASGLALAAAFALVDVAATLSAGRASEPCPLHLAGVATDD